MTDRCLICGRVTLRPALLLGGHPIGPKCAAKTGLAALKGVARGVVATASRSRRLGARNIVPERCSRTPDLFEGLGA